MLDTVGGDIYGRSFGVVKVSGIIVSMVSIPNEILMKQYGVRSVHVSTKVDSKTLGKITDLIKCGALHVNISNIYPLKLAKEAFEAKEKEKILGKIAIEVKKAFT